MKTLIIITCIINCYFFLKDLMDLYENYKLQKEWLLEKEKYFNEGGKDNGNFNDKGYNSKRDKNG